MRKIFTTLFIMSFMLSAQAQYLPNSSFENWKGSGNAGSTYQSSDGSLGGGTSALGMRQRPGDEPADWQGSSINQKVWMDKAETLITASEYGVTGSAVRMENKYVGVMGIGSDAPGFISFATPWVYAISDVNSCDGGVYGGMQFKHRPDAIKGWFKRTGNTGEAAHIIVYTWKGTFKSNIRSSAANDTKDDADRAVMGKESALQSGTLIASCDYTFTTTNGDGWQEITVPLNYRNDETPEKVNVILSSGDYWTRSNMQAGSVLEADDVQFVYYSELASFKYDGVNYFESGKKVYEVAPEYDESKLSISSNGKSATIEKSYNADTKVLTVTVKGGDYALNGSNVHEYFINFGSDEPVVGPSETEELGDKLLSLDNADLSKTYVLYNEAYTTYAVYNASHSDRVWVAGMKGGDSSHQLLNTEYSTPVDITSANSSWLVVKSGDKYSLYNVGAKQYLNTATTGCTFSSAAVWLSAVELGDGKFAFNATSDNLAYMCAAPQLEMPVAAWESTDAGSAWQLIENPNVDADETFVPEVKPEPDPELQDWYSTITKPVFNGGGNTITISSLKFNDEAVAATYTKGVTNCVADPLAVEAGKTYSLNVEYVINWGEISMFQIDKNGTEKKYGHYTCSWEAYGDPMTIFKRDNSQLMCEAFGIDNIEGLIEGSKVTLPYQVTIDENLQPGDFVVVRLLVGKAGEANGAYDQNIAEGGCLDVLFKVKEADSETGVDKIETEQEGQTIIYDLQGRIVDNPQKGIYIINGKKVYIK